MYYRENELSYFAGHHVFRHCNSNLYGVEQLSKKLTTVLVNKIKQELVSYHLLVLSFILVAQCYCAALCCESKGLGIVV